ncbi:MAG TPA: CheR family methyltransferase [Kineosporiaceae bacterium]|nr:CheR family methyltransferase [Kineosporiaceae bacterium]
MTAADPEFEALLQHLKDNRGFDFTGYKRASLTRRVDRRLSALGIGSYAEYLDHLQVSPDEFTALFNTILINVTEFFRDADAWHHLRSEVLPVLLAEKGPNDSIRVWAAGCASGEEAYSLVIALCEELGVDDYKDRVKIYATDVDEEALIEARHATYSVREIQNVPPELVETYFEQHGQRYVFRKDLRRSVIFGRNDLVQDAPISRIDLLVCRNVLMYFNAETQARILRRFHFALAPGGVLFLGKAEMLLGHGALFAPLDVRRRVFRKVAGPVGAGDGEPWRHGEGMHATRALTGVDLLREEAMLAGPMPHVVVGVDGRVVLANRQAEMVFGVSARDMGRPFRDLELSYRPAELRGLIEQAQLDRRTVRVKDVDYLRGTSIMHLEIQVTPLADREGEILGVSISFQDNSEAFRLRTQLEHTNRELETAYEELQSTNEELETTNEELQSTVEELETTNEELQSTNEELETMNEELQSTNDELQAINDELRERTDQLNDANAFLASVLTGLRAGVAVLDRDMHIQVWNRPAEDLWGLRSEEAVGQHFLNLDIGLAVERLRNEVRRAVSDGGAEFEAVMPAINRFGRDVEVRVVGSPLRRSGEVRGAILVMDVLTQHQAVATVGSGGGTGAPA